VAASVALRPRRPRSQRQLRTARAAQAAARAKKGGAQQESKPRGPIKERSDGRIYAVDDLDDAAPIDFDDIATSAPKDSEPDDRRRRAGRRIASERHRPCAPPGSRTTRSVVDAQLPEQHRPPVA
jgi:hypothetical protein